MKRRGSSSELRSDFLPNIDQSKIFTWSYLCLEELVMSPLNSKKGISVANEDPYGFKYVNISRRGVLRQYYGKDVTSSCCKNLYPRFTYGYNKCNSSVNTDPYNYVTKPFNYYLNNLSKQVHALLLKRRLDSQLEGLDLSTPFNHCTALIYYAGSSLKPLSHMPFHCDVSYNHKGQYVASRNEQVENTPSVIISLGDSRKIHWQQQTLQFNEDSGRMKWCNVHKSKFMRTMNIVDKSIYIVNTLDEKPVIDPASGCFIRYQHGNVNVRRETMSCALVLRVVNKIHTYNDMNQLVDEHASVKGEEKFTIDEEMNKLEYNHVAANQTEKTITDVSMHHHYHEEIKQLFRNKFKSYRS